MAIRKKSASAGYTYMMQKGSVREIGEASGIKLFPGLSPDKTMAANTKKY